MRFMTFVLASLFVWAAQARADWLPSGGVCGERCRLVDDDTRLIWSRTMPPAGQDEARRTCEAAALRLPTQDEWRQAAANGMARAADVYRNFGTVQAAFWADADGWAVVVHPRFANVAPSGALPYRCVTEDWATGSGLACQSTFRVAHVVYGNPGEPPRMVYETRSGMSLLEQAQELVRRHGLVAREDDDAVARVLANLLPTIEAFSGLAESLIGAPLDQGFMNRQNRARQYFESIIRELTRADQYLRLPPASVIFLPSEIENLRCEAKKTMSNVNDPGVANNDAVTCPAGSRVHLRVFCQVPDGSYLAYSRGAWWRFIDKHARPDGYDYLMRHTLTGENLYFRLDEFPPVSL